MAKNYVPNQKHLSTLWPTIVITGVVVLIAVFLFYQYLDFHEFFDEHSEKIIDQFFFNFDLLYAIMAIFTIFAIWEKYNAVIEALSAEAAILRNILNLVWQVRDSSIKTKFTSMIEAYTKSIIDALWGGKTVKDEAEHFNFDRAFSVINQMKVEGEKDAILYDNLLDELREVTEARAKRKALLRERITALQWATLLLLPVGLQVAFLLVGGHTTLRLALFIVQTIVFTWLTIILYDLDEPIHGRWGVSNQSYVEILDEIRQHRQK